METTYLFLDCEWADVFGADLVSLALISADGQHRFYAERDPLPSQPTDFVRAVVYPLLDRGAAASPDAEITRQLRKFFLGIPSPCVVFDDQNDGALLRYALAGFDLSDVAVDACGPVSSPLMQRLVPKGALNTFLEGWFHAHPDAAVRRHHAMVDAIALRGAWLATQDQ